MLVVRNRTFYKNITSAIHDKEFFGGGGKGVASLASLGALLAESGFRPSRIKVASWPLETIHKLLVALCHLVGNNRHVIAHSSGHHGPPFDPD